MNIYVSMCMYVLLGLFMYVCISIYEIFVCICYFSPYRREAVYRDLSVQQVLQSIKHISNARSAR